VVFVCDVVVIGNPHHHFHWKVDDPEEVLSMKGFWHLIPFSSRRPLSNQEGSSLEVFGSVNLESVMEYEDATFHGVLE